VLAPEFSALDNNYNQLLVFVMSVLTAVVTQLSISKHRKFAATEKGRVQKTVDLNKSDKRNRRPLKLCPRSYNLKYNKYDGALEVQSPCCIPD